MSVEKKPDDVHSSGTHDYPCYRIEARVSHGVQIMRVKDNQEEMVLTQEWKWVPTVVSPSGVPSSLKCPIGERNGYLSYHQAKSLQHLLHAHFPFCFTLETRLVRYKGHVTHEFKIDKPGKVLEHLVRVEEDFGE